MVQVGKLRQRGGTRGSLNRGAVALPEKLGSYPVGLALSPAAAAPPSALPATVCHGQCPAIPKLCPVEPPRHANNHRRAPWHRVRKHHVERAPWWHTGLGEWLRSRDIHKEPSPPRGMAGASPRKHSGPCPWSHPLRPVARPQALSLTPWLDSSAAASGSGPQFPHLS